MIKSLEEKIAEIDNIAKVIPAIIVIHEMVENYGVILQYISPKGLELLKISKEEIIGIRDPEYYGRFFNSEDVVDYAPKVLELLVKNDEKEIISYFQQVRSSENEDYKWYLTTSKIFMKDLSGVPSHIISFAHPIDPQHHLTIKVNRLLDENNFLRRNHKIFASLSKREKEILKFMALGENSDRIANKLNISEATVNTHRRNIRSKLDVDSNYDLVRFAQAFDLI